MARRCKCSICKKDLTTDKAYKITNNKGKTTYYCTKEEYEQLIKEKQDKEHCLEMVAQYMRLKFATPIIIKEINKLHEYYEYIVIEKCFKENEKAINWFLDNNEDSSEFGKVRYCFTIIQNNINKTYQKHKKELEQIQGLFKIKQNEIDVNIINDISNNKPIRKDVNDISMFLD